MFNSSGSGSDVGGQPPPLPMAYGIHVLHESGYLTNKTHSNTAGKWHWHKRKEQTSHRTAHPGTRHTSGHPTRMALPPPVGVKQKQFLLITASTWSCMKAFICLWFKKSTSKKKSLESAISSININLSITDQLFLVIFYHLQTRPHCRTLQGRSLEVHCACNKQLHQELPLIYPGRVLFTKDIMNAWVKKTKPLKGLPTGCQQDN